VHGAGALTQVIVDPAQTLDDDAVRCMGTDHCSTDAASNQSLTTYFLHILSLYKTFYRVLCQWKITPRPAANDGEIDLQVNSDGNKNDLELVIESLCVLQL